MAKQRDPVLNVCASIGIVLMVLGHLGFPSSNFIYLFHMALFFFMLSGWFFLSPTRAAPSAGPTPSARWSPLWLPFVASQHGQHTLLTNLFLSKHPDRGTRRILDLPGNLITTPVTIKDIIGRTALERF